MSNESPDLLVARALRDSARQLRSLAQSAEVAEVALREEKKFEALVLKLEAKREQPELALAGAA